MGVSRGGENFVFSEVEADGGGFGLIAAIVEVEGDGLMDAFAQLLPGVRLSDDVLAGRLGDESAVTQA